MAIPEKLKAYHHHILTDPNFMLLLDAIESETAYVARPWQKSHPVNEAEFAYDSGFSQGQLLTFNKLRGKL